jgi:hypothetical protein
LMGPLHQTEASASVTSGLWKIGEIGGRVDACRMVEAARNARLSVALTEHSNRVSTNASLRRWETQFSRAETKTPKRPLQFNGQIAETKCVHESPPVRGDSH